MKKPKQEVDPVDLVGQERNSSERPEQYCQVANALPRLVEYSFSVVPSGPQASVLKLKTNLNIFVCEFRTEQIRASIRECSFSIHAPGFTVIRDEVLGEVPRTSKTIQVSHDDRKSTKSELHSDTNAKLGVKATPVGAVPSAVLDTALSARAAIDETSSTQAKYIEQVKIQFVHYSGEDTWTVKSAATDSTNAFLQGKYLNASILCDLAKNSGANRYSVSSLLWIYEKDLDVEPVGGIKSKIFNLRSINMQKFMKLIAAESLFRKLNDDKSKQYEGVLLLSKGEVDVDV